jgi:ADP-ribose pyrophosphatase YjhB (NUDIX family)/energy-coupling factor transporter ATP-binding protein EcfA2
MNNENILSMTIQGLCNKAFQLAFNTTEPSLKASFSQNNTIIDLWAEAALVSLLSSYLHYSQTTSATAQLTIKLVENQSFWEVACNTLTSTDWTPILDYGDLGKIVETAGLRLVAYKSLRAVFVIDYQNSQVCIVAPSSVELFVAGYKAVRQTLTYANIAKGARVLHASAVEINKRALLIVGPKGAGKSTALIQLLSGRIKGLKYIANDRVLVWAEDGNMVVGCWPTVAGFGSGTLKSIAGLDKVITPKLYVKSGCCSLMLLDLKRMDPNWPKVDTSTSGKIRLNPMDLSYAFHLQCGSFAPVAAILDSTLTNQDNKLTPLNLEELTSVIQMNEESSVRNHPSWLAWPEILTSEINPCALASEIVKGVNGFRFAGGPKSAESLRALAVLIGRSELRGNGALRHHFGVYALIQNSNEVLVVRKTRGPYEGWLDLPGGGAEAGESLDETLERELQEELSANIRMRGAWSSFSLLITRDSKGTPIQFAHEGYVAEVKLHNQSSLRPSKLTEDVANVLWISRDTLEQRQDISASLLNALKIFPKN